jgi:hypothetical protein
LFVAGTDVRGVSGEGALIGQPTIHPSKNYQPMERV